MGEKRTRKIKTRKRRREKGNREKGQWKEKDKSKWKQNSKSKCEKEKKGRKPAPDKAQLAAERGSAYSPAHGPARAVPERARGRLSRRRARRGGAGAEGRRGAGPHAGAVGARGAPRGRSQSLGGGARLGSEGGSGRERSCGSAGAPREEGGSRCRAPPAPLSPAALSPPIAPLPWGRGGGAGGRRQAVAAGGARSGAPRCWGARGAGAAGLAREARQGRGLPWCESGGGGSGRRRDDRGVVEQRPGARPVPQHPERRLLLRWQVGRGAAGLGGRGLLTCRERSFGRPTPGARGGAGGSRWLQSSGWPRVYPPLFDSSDPVLSSSAQREGTRRSKLACPGLIPPCAVSAGCPAASRPVPSRPPAPPGPSARGKLHSAAGLRWAAAGRGAPPAGSDTGLARAAHLLLAWSNLPAGAAERRCS